MARRIATKPELDAAMKDYTRWNNFNVELLKRIFDSPAFADEYSDMGPRIFFLGPEPLHKEVKDLRDEVEVKINHLLSIDERLELVPESDGSQSERPVQRNVPRVRVFIVHGHDSTAREMVARFIEKLGLEA
jgi:hypothetical protein